MQENEKFKDWIFRYQHLYRLRRTKNQKQRFIRALITDISEMRSDIQILEYGEGKGAALRNVYVGDIEKADRILCTYYDTPSKAIGMHDVFNRKVQRNAVLKYICLSSLCALGAGILLLAFFVKNTGLTYHFSLSSSLLYIISFGVYFYVLGKIGIGLAERKTAVRNTSSILAILLHIQKGSKEKLAYAFLDEGCFGETGLQMLKKRLKSSAQIDYLDCVDCDTTLHYFGNGWKSIEAAPIVLHQPLAKDMNYLVGAREIRKNAKSRFLLKKSDLNTKSMCIENIYLASKFYL